MTSPALPDDPTAVAVRIVRELLGERDATKVQVEITRGGTCRVQAETGEAQVVRHMWRAKG